MSIKPSSSNGPPKKKIKSEVKNKHNYPVIPSTVDDDVSNERNLNLLKQEAMKAKPSNQTIKSLMPRTCAVRRSAILNGDYSCVLDIVEDYPVLKRTSYVSQIYLDDLKFCFIQAKLEFELIMQHPNMKDEFENDFEKWAKAVIVYAQRNCTKLTAIQSIIQDIDLECEFVDVFFVCLL